MVWDVPLTKPSKVQSLSTTCSWLTSKIQMSKLEMKMNFKENLNTTSKYSTLVLLLSPTCSRSTSNIQMSAFMLKEWNPLAAVPVRTAASTVICRTIANKIPWKWNEAKPNWNCPLFERSGQPTISIALSTSRSAWRCTGAPSCRPPSV